MNKSDAALCRPIGASCSASPTIDRMRALQAGHFNDFLFVALLRAATLAAIRTAGPDGLCEDEFGRRFKQALGFTAGNRGGGRNGCSTLR